MIKDRNLRVLFYRAGSCNELRVLDNMQKIIDKVFVVVKECVNNDMDPQLAAELFTAIYINNIDVLFSIDYYPIVAEVANTAGIVYISWIIDAPHYTLYSTTSRYDSTYIFHFDREECERLKTMGRPNVFHQPLASDPEYFQGVIKSETPQKMDDISFLGSSYQNEYDYFEMNYVPENTYFYIYFF